MSTPKMPETDVKPLIASDTIPRPLTALTPELKCLIFTNLPDVTSAKSLALVSSSFYYTFLDAQSLILTQILQNEISTDLVQGACAAYKASKIPLWTKQAVEEFLDRYFERFVHDNTPKWDLSEALHMSKVHTCVEFFAAEFASLALSKNPSMRGSNAAPSSTEMIRIKRILYRFELYCNLFRKPRYDQMRRGERNCLIQPSPFEAEEQQKIFFDKFSPWENEQLGCIHDYLIKEITAPFADVAKHDVDWGENHIPWVNMFGDSEMFYKSRRLLNGLEFVFQLSTARTYVDRHKVLSSNHGSEGSFLSDALKPSRLLQSQDATLEDHYDEEESLFMQASFDDDNDRGPAEAWRWAYAARTENHFYFLEDYRPLRQRGYVMWDLKRLLGWHLLDNPVEDLISRHIPDNYGRWGVSAEELEQEESWQERDRIWGEGGRGWWAPGDESQIKWPKDHKNSRVQEIPSKSKYTLALPEPLPVASRPLDR